MKRALTGFLLSLSLIVLLVWMFLQVPEWMANQYRFTCTKDWATQVAANRTAVVNAIGSIAIAGTIFFTWRNYKVSQESLRVTQESLRITMDKSITDLYSKGIEQLGHADMVVRLGGIQSLARIARISQPDYFPIMHVLTGLLRNSYGGASAVVASAATLPGLSRCPVEVQTVLTIVGERYWQDPEDYYLDLSCLEVSDAWVPRANFSDVYFWNVSLTNCNFQEAKLKDADFKDATLIDCDFTGADLRGAQFNGAQIRNCKGLERT